MFSKLESALLGQYWTTIYESFSDVYLSVVAIILSLLVFLYSFREKNSAKQSMDESKSKGNFEISPDDEMSFESLLNPDELREAKSAAQSSKYQALNAKRPTRQIEKFLNQRDDPDSDDEDTLSEEEEEIGSARSLMSRIKLTRQEALRKKLESEMSEKDRLEELMVQQQQLAKIYSLLSENGDCFGNVTFEDVQKQMSMYSSGENI